MGKLVFENWDEFNRFMDDRFFLDDCGPGSKVIWSYGIKEIVIENGLHSNNIKMTEEDWRETYENEMSLKKRD